MMPNLGIEPGPHWWEASTLTTAPSLRIANRARSQAQSDADREQQQAAWAREQRIRNIIWEVTFRPPPPHPPPAIRTRRPPSILRGGQFFCGMVPEDWTRISVTYKIAGVSVRGTKKLISDTTELSSYEHYETLLFFEGVIYKYE